MWNSKKVSITINYSIRSNLFHNINNIHFFNRSWRLMVIKWEKYRSNGLDWHARCSPMPISSESISQWIWTFEWKRLCSVHVSSLYVITKFLICSTKQNSNIFTFWFDFRMQCSSKKQEIKSKIGQECFKIHWKSDFSLQNLNLPLLDIRICYFLRTKPSRNENIYICQMRHRLQNNTINQ